MDRSAAGAVHVGGPHEGDVPERGASFVGQAGGELHIDAVRPEAIAHRALDPPGGVLGRVADRCFAGSVGEEEAAVLPGGEHRAGGVGRRAVHDVLKVEADGVVPVEVLVRVAQIAQGGETAPLAVGVRLVVEEEAPEGAAVQSDCRCHAAVSPISNFIGPLRSRGGIAYTRDRHRTRQSVCRLCSDLAGRVVGGGARWLYSVGDAAHVNAQASTSPDSSPLTPRRPRSTP